MNSTMFFQWETPNDPSTPFATGILVFDLMRIIVITLSLAIGLLAAAAVVRPGGTLGQKARLVGMGMIFMLFLATGQWSHIGDYGHWRLVLAAFPAAVISTWGLWSYYAYEKPAEIKPAHLEKR